MIDTVSVLVPTFNQAHLLPHALRSLQGQTHPTWQAIVIDDGSSDNPSSVVIEVNDPRISYVHQENEGLASARNTGLTESTGKYIAFLDADDEWEPEFLSRCMATLSWAETTGAVGVYTSHIYIDSKGQVLPQRGRVPVEPGQLYARLLEGGFFPPIAVMIRRDVLLEIGAFDEGIEGQRVEDWELWLRVSKSFRLVGIEEALVRYRVYPGTLSSDANIIHASRMAALNKHFGPEHGEPTSWQSQKRVAYGFAYRKSCDEHIQVDQIEEGWDLLVRGFAIWPPLFGRLDTFYELVCGNQPRGFRGTPEHLNLDLNAADVLARLEETFQDVEGPLRVWRNLAFSNAHLAIGMLHDITGNWKDARRHILLAMTLNPRIATSIALLRRMIRLAAGRRLAGLARTAAAVAGIRQGAFRAN